MRTSLTLPNQGAGASIGCCGFLVVGFSWRPIHLRFLSNKYSIHITACFVSNTRSRDTSLDPQGVHTDPQRTTLALTCHALTREDQSDGGVKATRVSRARCFVRGDGEPRTSCWWQCWFSLDKQQRWAAGLRSRLKRSGTRCGCSVSHERGLKRTGRLDGPQKMPPAVIQAFGFWLTVFIVYTWLVV